MSLLSTQQAALASKAMLPEGPRMIATFAATSCIADNVKSEACQGSVCSTYDMASLAPCKPSLFDLQAVLASKAMMDEGSRMLAAFAATSCIADSVKSETCQSALCSTHDMAS